MSQEQTSVEKSERETGLANYRQPTWNEIGDSFETLGKVGLALAVGLSAAGLFCRLAEQGKVRLPSWNQLLIPREEEEPNEERRKKRGP